MSMESHWDEISGSFYFSQDLTTWFKFMVPLNKISYSMFFLLVVKKT